MSTLIKQSNFTAGSALAGKGIEATKKKKKKERKKEKKKKKEGLYATFIFKKGKKTLH